MLFTTNKENLLSGLTTVVKASDQKAPLPALTGILFEVKDNTLHLVASDLEITIECSLPVHAEREGKIVLPAKQITDLIRKMPDNEITINAITDRHVLITYDDSEASLNGYSGDEFPHLPEFTASQSINIPERELKDILKKTSFAIDNDITRPIFNSLLIEKDIDSINFVATDTHRLAFYKYTPRETQLPDNINLLLPKKAVDELQKLLNDSEQEIRIEFNETQIRFSTPEYNLTSRLTTGNYPPYKQVIPKKYVTTATVHTKAFIESCERASLVAKSNQPLIKLTLNSNELTIFASTELGRIKDTIVVSKEGEDIDININVKYLSESLKAMDEETITISFSGTTSPLLIKPSNNYNYFNLLVPSRKNQ